MALLTVCLLAAMSLWHEALTQDDAERRKGGEEQQMTVHSYLISAQYFFHDTMKMDSIQPVS